MSGEFDVTPFEIEPFVADEASQDVLPYPGLRPFKKSEHRFFFGRSDQVAEIVEILAQQGHFVTAIGPSGCGKSSLIRAGVQPALEFGLIPSAGQRWVNAKMRPGDAPLAHLRDALVEASRTDAASTLNDLDRAQLKAMLGGGRGGLARFFETHPLPPGRRLLLLIDQFEELFRYDVPRSDAGDFVSLLVELFREPLKQVFVILTMRTDYIGDCTRFPGLAEVINKTFYLIPPLNRTQLTEAISRPAVEVGGRVQPQLVDQLLRDMHGSDDPLPLVQHALMWMWIRARQQRDEAGKATGATIELTLDDYYGEQVEGLNRALSNHADHVIATTELGSTAARDAELFFRQLVQRDDSRFIRRPAKAAEIIDSTLSDDGSEPLLDIEVLRKLANRLAGDDAGFIFVQTESATGDETPALTEESTIDIGHEALIRQWASLREWAQAEADTGDRMKALTKEAVEWEKGERGLLDKLSMETYGQAWQGVWRLFAGGKVIDRGRLPPRRWSGRYLRAAAQDPSHDDEQTRQGIYNLNHDFWTASKRYCRRIRMAKRFAVAAVAGLPLLALLAGSVAEQNSRLLQIEGEIASSFNRSLDAGKYGDAPAYRALAMDAGKNADDIEANQSLPLKVLHPIRATGSKALARDLQDLYLDLADLHGIAGGYWTSVDGNGEGQTSAASARPVLNRSASNLHVPIASATHFKGSRSADCVAVLDAVGELSIACDKGNGERAVTPKPKLLRSALPAESDPASIDPACFGPRGGCRETGEWLRLTRIARSGSRGQLLAVAPDRSVHVCRIESEETETACTELNDATRYLRQLGDRLRGLAIDDEGRYLAAIHWFAERDDGFSSDWYQGRTKRRLFTLSFVDLSEAPQTPVTRFRLQTDDFSRFPADISRFPEPAAVAIWLQGTEERSGALTLTAAFDASILFQWQLHPQQRQAEGAFLSPQRSARVYLDPEKPVLAALSATSNRAILTGLSRPLALFDLTRTDGPEQAGAAKLGGPTSIIAQLQSEWTLLTTRPSDLKFVDDDLIAVSDSQANAFLIRFGPSDKLRLDPPPQFSLPTSLFVIDSEKPVIYGIAPDREKTTHILRWEIAGEEDRAMLIRIPRETTGSAETVVGRRLVRWRTLIDDMGRQNVTGIEEIPPLREKKSNAAPAFTCQGMPPAPLALYPLPGNRLWIAVCGRGAVNILAAKPGQDAGKKEAYKLVARLQDPLTVPVRGAGLFCLQEQAAAGGGTNLPEGCWLVIEAKELFSREPRLFDLVYHFPRAGAEDRRRPRKDED